MADQKNLYFPDASVRNDGRRDSALCSGGVASSDDWIGSGVERKWVPFTAKMIFRSSAQVLPVHFPGQNRLLYQITSNTPATLR